ncbi:ANK-REP-REGION domain-containing protein [Mycena chlorophos]|uniref:ANK-REP-REGION domain-containing protein n=1 Tax=Mycena chlorophos TaxID=658473 RepID=A0A8H6TS41_MYCCL|nr:ANK-REP-REGION domain-containing protein [Mycena chlorophos]
MTIHTEARDGSLRPDSLAAYLRDDPNALTTLDPTTGLPPLATAAVAGFPDVVQLLITRDAPVDALSRDGGTALLLTMKDGAKDRARIAQLLLAKMGPGSVDSTSAANSNNTPLMYATVKGDIDSIRLLVEAGASITKTNDAGLTAMGMAPSGKVKLSLEGRKKEKGIFARLASAALETAKFAVSWVQKKATGVLKRLFNWSPVVDKVLDEKINDGETPNDDVFLDNIDDFVQETPSLQRFFKDKDYIQQLAKKAVELKNDTSTSLGDPNVLPKTIKVTLHQQVIYCDDSSSMKRDGRWAAQAELVARIARITTRVLPDGDGVALRFINQDVDQSDKLSLEQLKAIMDKVSWVPSPNGETAIGTFLRRKILEPMVYSKIEAQPPTLRRPLLVSIITDGMPSQEDNGTLVEMIKECGTKLVGAGYPRESVKFLQGIAANDEIRNDIFVVTEQLDDKFRSFRDNERDLDRWLIETLFTPIMRR